MRDQWLAMEHYRLHTVEEWPEGPRKTAVLSAIRSTLTSLGYSEEQDALHCHLCSSRKPRLVQFPAPSSDTPVLVEFAA